MDQKGSSLLFDLYLDQLCIKGLWYVFPLARFLFGKD